MRSRAPGRILRVIAVAALCFVAAEATVRAYYAWSLGRRTLLYGTSWYRDQHPVRLPDTWAQRHRNFVGDYRPYANNAPTGYAKYFPNEVKYTDSPDGREQYAIRINNHGFRGPDFADAKGPGVRRILTLGASSTFGYHDRDDETYPYYLQKLLDEARPGRFEVINFAIPHATSGNIAAMLLAEGFALAPDIVTFYEGVNDAGIFEEATQTPGGWQAIGERSLLVRVLGQFLAPSLKPDHWTDAFAARRSREFLANLEVIARAAEEHGVRFLVATQQAKSKLFEAAALRGVTYAQEVALVREKFERGEIGPKAVAVGPRNPVLEVVSHMDPARILLVHDRLMRDLRAWAPQRGVELVDVQAALDQRRDLILTWVHLAPEANRIVAAALAEAILAEDARAATAAH